jgi:hypothetical protein
VGKSTAHTIGELMRTAGQDAAQLQDPDVASLVVHHNQVLGSKLIPGFEARVEELEDGISAVLTLREGTVVQKPVHLCFGMLPEKGVQRIRMSVMLERGSRIAVLAHCAFPNAVDVQHIMDAHITVGEGAHYSYFERHVHGPDGGVLVYPKARVVLEEGAHCATEFELLRGRVGEIDIDYETICKKDSVLEMNARISGTGNDRIKISESAILVGEGARGVLTSRIAVRDTARAEVLNTLKAQAPYTRGHVDCKEIIQDRGNAKAVPIVEVGHPRAHVTHEAAIGSVDSKQLETLMTRGLSEDDAVDLIIEGLLS